jgi:ribulose-5-phosphate 4-epimerase/fuculose-1-phosphate aldolase
LTAPGGDAAPRSETARLREEIALAARALAKLGYAHAFGHVSARQATSILITPTNPPLAVQHAADVLEVAFDGTVPSGDPRSRPIEVFLHLGIYRAREDVGGICRAHPTAASLWWGGAVPPVRHGFGGIVGEVATYDQANLIHNADLGATAAQRLGRAGGLLLRGNGALTVGNDVGQAAARMWSLEQRYAHVVPAGAPGTAFSRDDLRARQLWYPAEAERIWAWMKHLEGVEGS